MTALQIRLSLKPVHRGLAYSPRNQPRQGRHALAQQVSAGKGEPSQSPGGAAPIHVLGHNIWSGSPRLIYSFRSFR